MANIRASAAATTILVATASAVSIGIAAAGGVTATAQPTPVIRASAFAVPMSVLEHQTVLMSDFRSFDIGQVTIDVATATDDVAISFNASFSDTATAPDTAAKDLTRPDVADTATMADTTVKDAGKVATDSVTGADALVADVGKTLTDNTAAVTDAAIFDQNKSPSDSVTGTDTINKFDVTTVFTDSVTINAGIVYIIRTESYSYMFSGYGLNENQLN